ncbi:formate hydrogenlyase complex iron-sulfur subunit [Sulfurospirillum sp. 1612]|uniref:formate hydrogenlyase complex iron-sulfur subunit n=1 Tax=Sulfurospirillum sp. 1612 TaxID=3094835 RepID=UPI002F91FD64
MKLLDMTRKYGGATYAYPFEPYEVPENFRGKPNYDYAKCIGCTACAVACPSNAINVKLNKTGTKLVWEFDCGRCIYCGRCDEVCPTNAVFLSHEFETAVKFNKDDLKVRGELEVEYCHVCKKPYTTKRLIAYDIERLKNVGWSTEGFDAKVEHLYTCPECKKKKAVEQACHYFIRSNK